jgi:hypothetical protein
VSLYISLVIRNTNKPTGGVKMTSLARRGARQGVVDADAGRVRRRPRQERPAAEERYVVLVVYYRKFLFIYSKFLSFFHSCILFSVCSNFFILADSTGASALFLPARRLAALGNTLLVFRGVG